jgi:hypothetical protein
MLEQSTRPSLTAGKGGASAEPLHGISSVGSHGKHHGGVILQEAQACKRHNQYALEFYMGRKIAEQACPACGLAMTTLDDGEGATMPIHPHQSATPDDCHHSTFCCVVGPQVDALGLLGKNWHANLEQIGPQQPWPP